MKFWTFLAFFIQFTSCQQVVYNSLIYPTSKNYVDYFNYASKYGKSYNNLEEFWNRLANWLAVENFIN